VDAVADLAAKVAYSDGGFTAGTGVFGSGQFSSIPIAALTNSNTPTMNLCIGGGANSTLQASNILIRQNFLYAFTLTLAAARNDGTGFAMFTRQGMITNIDGTVSLVGSVSTVGADNNAGGWGVAITADNVNKALQIAVTGPTFLLAEEDQKGSKKSKGKSKDVPLPRAPITPAQAQTYWMGRLDLVEIITNRVS
jgi:hypothetical protein